MQIQELMTRDVDLVAPGTSVEEAARRMRNDDVGALPVGDNDRLVGMITDRDLTVRATATGRTDASVGDVLSEDVYYCFEDEDIESAANQMAEHQIRRLPVMNRDKRLVGIISLGDISRRGNSAGEALAEISQPNEAPRR